MSIQPRPISELTANCTRFTEYLVRKGINAEDEGFPVAATFELAELQRQMQGTDAFKPKYLRVYHGMDENNDLHVFVALLDENEALDTSGTGAAASIATGTETKEPELKGRAEGAQALKGSAGRETQAFGGNAAPDETAERGNLAQIAGDMDFAGMGAMLSTSTLRMAAKIPPGNATSDAILNPVRMA
ncbi:MAG TPA: hypothetical protein VF646_02525 [Cytophagales bacterium]|jgi:hypothetical protein